MAMNPHRLEEGGNDDYGSEPNACSTNELAAISVLASEAGEMMVIRTLQRFIRPIFVPIFRPLIRQHVEEQIGLAKQELLASMKENPDNKASTSVLKKLKLKFRNRIALPVFTGMPLLGENQTPIEIALVDALSDQIVNTGIESNAKLEIMGFRVNDDGGSWTFEVFQERIVSERKGRRILQGNTCLQLNEGIGFVHKISFTHNSEHTKNGLFILGATVVDAALMNRVEVAWTETFVMKDQRYTYYEKHAYPCLSDKVCHLQKIRYKGNRYKRLQNAGVYTVKDLLILLYTDPKRLEDILKLKASSKIWDDIVKNALASAGMFLYLDSEQKTGVVLNVKLELKALIVGPNQYISVNQLSDKQKVDNQNLVKFASEHLEILPDFEDETSLKEHLQSDTGLTEAQDNMNNSNLHIGQSTNHTPIVTSQSKRGKEKVPFDNEMINYTNYNQEYISFYPPNMESLNRHNFGTGTEPGPSSQAVESLIDTCGLMNTSDVSSHSLGDSEFNHLLNYVSAILSENPNNECHSNPAAVFCTIALTRWKKVSKLLRRNSVRERIGLSQGIQPLKKQRCC